MSPPPRKAGPSSKTVSIPGRFNGPPASGNGGYTCGVVAALLGAVAAEVTLRSPPPLGRALVVQRSPGPAHGKGVRQPALRLLEGDQLVAEGHTLSRLELDPPEPVSGETAREAARRFPWYEGHPFPTCFVCGPRREEGDGLRIFAGAAGEGDVFACPWTPAAEWAEDGLVRSEIVWAALDCPSAVAAASLAGVGPGAAVLARIAASIDRGVRPEEPHVVVAWPLGREGRKREAGTAIVDAGGEVRARARALWIELRG